MSKVSKAILLTKLIGLAICYLHSSSSSQLPDKWMMADTVLIGAKNQH